MKIKKPLSFERGFKKGGDPLVSGQASLPGNENKKAPTC
jgi:hypothetical protein